jgi:hypothetical protein
MEECLPTPQGTEFKPQYSQQKKERKKKKRKCDMGSVSVCKAISHMYKCDRYIKNFTYIYKYYLTL